LNNDIKLFQSNDQEADKLFSAIIAGKGPDVLINLGSNPVYTSAKGDALVKGLDSLKMFVSTSRYADESAVLSTFIVPNHHQLEGWNDYQAKANHYAVAQPTIRPLGDTYSELESILVWAGLSSRKGKDSDVAYEAIKTTASIIHKGDFALLTHNSCATVEVAPLAMTEYKAAPISNPTKGGNWEVVFYQKTAIRDGAMSSNPWLQELPDPISKVTWDNYITMSPNQMEELGFVTTFDQEHGLNIAKVQVNGTEITLPVYPQPGQAKNTIGIALGYGRGKNGERIGRGAYQTKEYG